ncbi:MAG: DUF3298 domain-containing protein [Clostridia bacterium]
MLNNKSKDIKVISKNKTIEPKLDDGTLLFASISYPFVVIPNNSKASEKINSYMENKADDFIDYIKKTLVLKAKKEYMQSVIDEIDWIPYQVYQNFVTTYNKSPYISFLTKINAYVGKADNLKTAYADSFNTITGEKITLEEIIKGRSYKEKIFKEIISQIKKSPEEYYQNYEELVINGMDYSNFYISKDGIAIYYNKGYLAPDELGEPLFIVPFDKLNFKV